MMCVAEPRVRDMTLSPSSGVHSPASPVPHALSLPLCFSSRLGLDDAAGLGAEDPGPGPWCGGGGEEGRWASVLVLNLIPGLPQEGR